jgi:predicted dehydrogenase
VLPTEKDGKMNLTPEERQVGRENFYEAAGVTRREFMRDVVAAGAVSGAGLGALAFDYDPVSEPVRVGVIGTGDEGGVLIGALSPEYMQVVAIADIRPSSIHRAFYGDWGGSNPNFTHSIRSGLMDKYGWATESEARNHVAVYDADNGGWEELIKNPDVEAVIIALPLHLHAKVAIAAMRAGKHVLTEKLMAHSVAECKEMCRVADETGLFLATGHQRHYSILYDNAVHMLQQGLFGEIHFIRAQWHRGNLPGRDSWEMPIPGGEKLPSGEIHDRIKKELTSFKGKLKRMDDSIAKGGGVDKAEYDLMKKRVAQWTQWDADQTVVAEDHGYLTETLSNGRLRTALEELVRWRLWDRTGGGLMAELGSHQLDAATIFISALHNRDVPRREDWKMVHPLTVHAVGGRHVFPYNRDADDHVYCMYEFPAPGYDIPDVASGQRPDSVVKGAVGYYDPISNFPNPETDIPGYDKDPNKRIVVTYSSTMGNGFGGYGEVVMGSKGTMIIEREQEAMLYRDSDTATKVRVKDDGGGAALDTQASGPPGAAVARAAADSGPVSRGYTEEMEHFAWCIRNASQGAKPRCYPELALGDAVMALTSKLAIRRANAGKGGFIEFKQGWFDWKDPSTPEEELDVS